MTNQMGSIIKPRRFVLNPLLLVVCAMLAAAPGVRGEAMTGKIRGVLLDEQGNPLADEPVGLIPSFPGREVLEAFKHDPIRTVTDEQGRYQFDATAGVHHRVIWGVDGGSRYGWIASVLPDPDATVSGGLPLEPGEAVLSGQLVDPEGRPLVDASVRVYPEYGEPVEGKTDADGRFSVTSVRLKARQNVLILDADGRSPRLAPEMKPVRPDSADSPRRVFRLVPTATLHGKVVAEQTGKGLADAIVEVRPAFVSGYALHTTTDATGAFRLTDLPAGEYKYRAQHADYADQPPERGYFFERTIKLKPGGTGNASAFAMKANAAFSGTVVDANGQPVSEAWVAGQTDWGDSADAYPKVQTDGDGRFTLPFTRFQKNGGDVVIQAYHPRMGSGTSTASPPNPTETSGDLLIQLGGTTRISGQVVGLAEPASRKTIISIWTRGTYAQMISNKSGSFDFGWIPFAADDDSVQISADGRTPSAFGILKDDRWVQFDDLPGSPPFVFPCRVNRPVRNGERLTVDLDLQTDETIRFAGQIKGLTDAERQGSLIFVFAGPAPDPITDAFVARLDVAEREGDPRRESGKMRSRDDGETWSLLAQVAVDREGRWSAFTSRIMGLHRRHTPPKSGDPATHQDLQNDVSVVAVLVTRDRRFAVLKPLSVAPDDNLVELTSDLADLELQPLPSE